MNQIDLSGRVAIVTGGASGLGLATATRFLASGARVTIWDRTEEGSDQARRTLDAGSALSTAVVDISDLAAVEQAVAEVEEREGKLDMMVNSAGISGLSSPTDEMDLSVWHDQLRVNLTGAFYCCRAAIAPMKRNGWGRMVTVSSAAGKDGNPQQVAYSAAKAGVIGMTKSLGKELAPFNILVNCIAPTVFAIRICSRLPLPEPSVWLLPTTPAMALSPRSAGATPAKNAWRMAVSRNMRWKITPGACTATCVAKMRRSHRPLSPR